MLNALDLVAQVTEQYPPETGHESRFGNPAFRKFYDQVALVSSSSQDNCATWSLQDLLFVYQLNCL